MTTVAFADEKTKQSFLEAQSSLSSLSKQLQKVNTQQIVNERESKLILATLNELGTFDETATKSYSSVGKMFLRRDLSFLKDEMSKKKESMEKENVAFKRASSKLERDVADVKSSITEILATAKPVDASSSA